jgi:RHS repeat-associated protein
MDDLPVGLLANGNQLHYLQPDHLGSPRVVIEATRNVPVWTWDLKGEAFGGTAPQQAPDGDGIPFVLDIRFPGQRYDAASMLNYNYFRDYDASTGRYSESDPIGLFGGISSYGYVHGRPLTMIDPLGLQSSSMAGSGATGSMGAMGGAYNPNNPDGSGLSSGSSGGSWPSWPQRQPQAKPTVEVPLDQRLGEWLFQNSPLGALSQLEQAISEKLNNVCDEDDDDDFCEKRYQIEMRTCRGLGVAERARRAPKGSASRCYESAQARLWACLNKRPDPPFHGWPQY